MPLVPYFKLVCDFCEKESSIIHEKSIPDEDGWLILKVKSPKTFGIAEHVLCSACVEAVTNARVNLKNVHDAFHP